MLTLLKVLFLVKLEKSKLSELSLQMIIEKQATDTDLIGLMADSCTHGNEAEETVLVSKYMQVQNLASQYWSKPAGAVSITPSETENVDIICVGSIVKPIDSEGIDGNLITMVILVVFTKYTGKFWM